MHHRQMLNDGTNIFLCQHVRSSRIVCVWRSPPAGPDSDDSNGQDEDGKDLSTSSHADSSPIAIHMKLLSRFKVLSMATHRRNLMICWMGFFKTSRRECFGLN